MGGGVFLNCPLVLLMKQLRFAPSERHLQLLQRLLIGSVSMFLSLLLWPNILMPRRPLA